MRLSTISRMNIADLKVGDAVAVYSPYIDEGLPGVVMMVDKDRNVLKVHYGGLQSWLNINQIVSILTTKPETAPDTTSEEPTGGDFENLGAEIGRVTDEKNKAYGSSFEKCGEFLKILWPDGVKVEQYRDMLAMVRIFDKQMRIANNPGAFGEDPYRDIAGYGLLGVKSTS